MAFLQRPQEVHDLRLDGHVERAGGLVQHQEPRFQHQGPRNRDPLALAARELVGIAVHGPGVDADLAQGVGDQGAAFVVRGGRRRG